MKMKATALTLLLFAAAAQADQASDDAKGAALTASLAYSQCGMAYAKSRASSNTTATEIAEAALAMCVKERGKIYDIVGSGLSPSRLDEFMSSMDKRVWRLAIEQVVEARMPPDRLPTNKGKG